jgi:cytoskeletal protein CcmA (bactofilin family)
MKVKDKTNPEKLDKAGSTSFFAESFKMLGNISAENDIRIEGIIQGDVSTSKKIVVGKTGQIIGNVKASNLHVLGEIIGEIYISDLVRIGSSAVVNGSIFSRNIQIESGAIVEATLKKLTSTNSENPINELNHYAENEKRRGLALELGTNLL